MRFLISVIDNQTGTASPAEMVAIDQFNDGLRERGQFIFAGGLSAPDSAKVIDNRSNRGEVNPGSLHQGTEYISGFWIVEAKDEAAALAIADGASLACNRRVELRPLL
jgi:hypothetical protein